LRPEKEKPPDVSGGNSLNLNQMLLNQNLNLCEVHSRWLVFFNDGAKQKRGLPTFALFCKTAESEFKEEKGWWKS
jgi:hypothetical protein